MSVGQHKEWSLVSKLEAKCNDAHFQLYTQIKRAKK